MGKAYIDETILQQVAALIPWFYYCALRAKVNLTRSDKFGHSLSH